MEEEMLANVSGWIKTLKIAVVFSVADKRLNFHKERVHL